MKIKNITNPSTRKSIDRSPLRLGFFLITLALACFALAPTAEAQLSPPPDGGYPNQNTAEGTDALFSLTVGGDNTAIGTNALYNNWGGNRNTATGSWALYSNTYGYENTAIGNLALVTNTTGGENTALGASALQNNAADNSTAVGAYALYSNTTGDSNSASGAYALYTNTTGNFNAATGTGALLNNTTGGWNTANGMNALISNTTGDFNTASGQGALSANSIGGANVATGSGALASNTDGSWNTATGTDTMVFHTTGSLNTATGANALHNSTTANLNIALGWAAGDRTTGNNNIMIGNIGVTAESNAIRIGTQATVIDEFGVTHAAHGATFIAGITGTTIPHGTDVFIDANGRLGVKHSSKRFKDEIKPMDNASEAILALKPVTFRYKKEFDPDGIPQFGLVAEDVAKVNPDLVVKDAEGKIYTVRYEAVNAMLLNEFLKEHRTVQALTSTVAKQEAIIAKQQKDFQATAAHQQEQIEALTEGLQKVSTRLEVSKPALEVVNNP
jgi:hypothetical protein